MSALQQTITDRLLAFELSLVADGCTSEKAAELRSEVTKQFSTAVKGWDASELDIEGLPTLERILLETLAKLEFHDVRRITFSDGATKETCQQCRYGKGYLRRGTAVNGTPHEFNTTAHNEPRFTARHQYDKSKTLVVVTHADASAAVTPETISLPNAELHKSETAAVRKYIDATTTEDRETALRQLATASRSKDVGKRRSKKEVLVNPEWVEAPQVSNDYVEGVWNNLNIIEDDDRRKALDELRTEKPEEHAWLMSYIKTRGKAQHSLQARSRALAIRRYLDRHKEKLVSA